MSAPILRRGDTIHLAVPIDNTLTGEALRAEGRRLNAEFLAMYAEYGVHIASLACNGRLTAPVVVAVFRPAADE